MAKLGKSKPKTIISVADGAGGMMEVKDRRFEGGDWPIKFEIPAEQEQADRWSRYLEWACHERGWSPSALGQLERAENSGTITLSANGKPQLEIVWERAAPPMTPLRHPWATTFLRVPTCQGGEGGQGGQRPCWPMRPIEP